MFHTKSGLQGAQNGMQDNLQSIPCKNHLRDIQHVYKQTQQDYYVNSILYEFHFGVVIRRGEYGMRKFHPKVACLKVQKKVLYFKNFNYQHKYITYREAIQLDSRYLSFYFQIGKKTLYIKNGQNINLAIKQYSRHNKVRLAMYQKITQNCPLAQLLINKVGRYSAVTKKVVINNFSNSIIKDEKQLKLYVNIMEILAMDNDKVQQTNRQKRQSKKRLQNLIKAIRNSKKQISQVNDKVQSQDQQEEQVPIDALGLAGEEGLKKLEHITDIIVSHCDEERKTKNVHKVFYLILKYLQFRIKTKAGFQQQMERRKQMEEKIKGSADNQIKEKDDIVRLLSDAGSLFWDDLKNNIPVSSCETGEKKQKKKKQVIKPIFEGQQTVQKKVRPDPKNMKNVVKVKLSQIEGSLHESSSQLSTSNSYHYLISLLETEQLQRLSTSLEDQIRNLNVEFEQHELWTKDEGDNLKNARDYLVSKLESVLELTLRRVYAKKFIHEGAGIEQNKPLLITSFIKREQRKKTTSLKWAELDAQKVPKDIYSKYNKLVIALKYITSILLGNQKIIALYCDSNIYLYLSLYMLYVERPYKNKQEVGGDEDSMSIGMSIGESNSALSQGRKMRKTQPNRKVSKRRARQRTVFDLQRFKQIAQQFLEKYFKVSLRGVKAKDQINLCHRLILQLFSLPLEIEHPYKHHPQRSNRVLAFHEFFQNLISYFVGYEFYAYLAITIIYNMGLVNKQLYMIDAEYENNIIGELLMNTVSEVKRFKGSDEVRQLDEYSVWNEDEQESIEIVPNQSENNGKKSQNLIKKSKLLAVPLETVKLLLCTISYYKHIIVKQKIQKQYYFKGLLQNSSRNRPHKELINSQVGYGALPLHQIIQNLISSSFIHERIISYELIDWLKQLAKYAHRFGVEEYILQYIKNLIILNMDSGERQQNKFNRYILELMVLEVKVCVWSYIQIYKKKPENLNDLLEKSYHFQTYTLNLFLTNYLLQWTLTSPFTYSLLDQVRELTGVDSELRKLSSQVAQQFHRFFAIYIKLQYITKRGKWIMEPDKDQIDRAHKLVIKQKKQKTEKNTEKKDQNMRKLAHMQRRLDSLAQILSMDNLEGCGEVLRVTWQIIEDYNTVKKQMSKQVLFAAEIEQQIQKMANKAVIVVEQLRNYISLMQEQNYITQELTKFKEMLF